MLSASFDICVLGSANSDLFLKVKEFPREGETINATDQFVKNGGKGANQAVASARLGSKTIFAGQMGKDGLANLLVKEMQQSGVNMDGLIQVDQVQTGQAIILLNEKGQNSIVIIGGANMYYQTNELPEQYINVLNNSQLLQLQMEVPSFINEQAAQHMNKAQKFVMLDCGGRADIISDRLLNSLTFISPNETELERIINHKVDEDSLDYQQDIVNMVRDKLLSQYPHLYVLLKLGSRGSMMITKDIHLWVNTAPFYNNNILKHHTIIDTVGAGDCFTSAFCSQLHNQCVQRQIRSPDELRQLPRNEQEIIFKQAMKFASASAFLCITQDGAMPSMPTLEQVRQFVNTYFEQQ